MNGRSRDLAPERGEPAPKDRRHEPETIDDHDGPPFDRCRHCGASGSIGAVNPYEECPDRREDVTDVDAETAPAR
jgi:hypothetical protein